MARLSDLSIGTKLGAVGAAICVMTAALAGVSIAEASGLSQGQQLMYERNVQAAVSLGRVRAAFNASAKDNTDMLITQEPEVKTAEVRDKNRAGHDAEVDQGWESYLASDPVSSSAQRATFEDNLTIYRQARVRDPTPKRSRVTMPGGWRLIALPRRCRPFQTSTPSWMTCKQLRLMQPRRQLHMGEPATTRHCYCSWGSALRVWL